VLSYTLFASHIAFLLVRIFPEITHNEAGRNPARINYFAALLYTVPCITVL